MLYRCDNLATVVDNHAVTPLVDWVSPVVVSVGDGRAVLVANDIHVVVKSACPVLYAREFSDRIWASVSNLATIEG